MARPTDLPASLRETCSRGKLKYDWAWRQIAMLITRLIKKLSPLVVGSAATLGLRRKSVSSPPGLTTRLNALETVLESQGTVNENFALQLKVVYARVEMIQKQLLFMTIGLIAIATVAALALAVAILS